MKLRMSALVAGSALVLSMSVLSMSQAQAQTPGWYIGLEGGWSHLDDISTSDGGTAFQLSPAEGFGVGGDLGYSFGRMRLEGEVSWRRNDAGSFGNIIDSRSGFPSVVPPGGENASGNINTLAFMGNVYYDFLPLNQFHPYVGAGVGAARLSLDSIGVAGFPLVDDSDVAFAYQGILGISYTINTNWSTSLDYRYFGTTGAHINDRFGGRGFDADTGSHNIMLGIAFHFAPPPPPMPEPIAAPIPVPAPAKAAPPQASERRFIVFFDFDKAILTPDGEKIVEEAADSYKQTGSAKVDLTGYTDAAGTQAYNLKLSQRRAEAVNKRLVALGVPADVIGTSWKGKEGQRVPTADGVREPQNRRVEIVMP